MKIDEVLRAYRDGYFPMGNPEDGRIYWCQPWRRAVVPLMSYRPSRVVRRLVERNVFEVCFNRDFSTVIQSCAAPRRNDSQTWIFDEIIAAYMELHEQGIAHSVECYCKGELAGGLYGLAIGGTFFGESMFYRVPNASKVAFDRLVTHLKEKGYELLDCQIMNPHLARLGAVEIEHEEYMLLLRRALEKPIRFL